MDNNVPDQDDRLIAAAQAAASWARARRATWTSASLPVVAPAAPAAPAALLRREADAHAASELFELPAHLASPSTHATRHPIPTHAEDRHEGVFAEAARPHNVPVGKWLRGAAVVAALGALAYIGLPYVASILPSRTASIPIAAPATSGPSAGAQKKTAALRVSSSPAGAQVLVDGKPRGVSPVTLTDLAAGRHEVALRSESGTVRRIVTLAAGETAAVEESIFSGWVVVYSPFEVSIVEGGRVLRPDDRNQVMLPPGIHELRLSNKTLAYDAVLQVDVKPGETTPVRLTPAPSALTVTASEAAEVWLDGVRVGDAPLSALPVPLGTHEVVVKRANGGERRFTVTIGVKPFTLNAEF